MKVLMLGWELPPHNSGGLGVACLQLCRALAGSGADIDFILPYSHQGSEFEFMKVHAASPEAFSANDILSVYESSTVRTGSIGYGLFSSSADRYTKAVLELSQRIEFDVIHAHDWLTFRAALALKLTSEKPLITHVHSIERDRSGGQSGNPLVREIEATAFLLADKIIAVSQRTADMISTDYGIPKDKIEVVHNSIDTESLQPISPENAYYYLTELKNQGYKIIVNIGRLTIQKGLTHLIRATAEVIKTAPKTIVLFVGSGEQRDELIELAAQMGISKNILFAGFQRGKNWRDAYTVADLFVLPSVSEPFGLTPLEAMGYRTPVLISKQSGVSEVIKNCLKVDFWDVDEMANKIHGIIQYGALTEELKDNGTQEYESMSWRDSADKLMLIYQNHRQKALA